ncbi:periplasmic protein TonB [Pandoraea thiooxydans]|uniref:Energy transducer TonB n=1 Tax=Pandoraea thiooxydans TaxID=445709 RepID=A0A0G3EU53_9BURK|nr:TonB family protein [Pandoraea thiooxydans]APR96675.1 periplasmic protein TonB [Pandoraea thiooxydans]
MKHVSRTQVALIPYARTQFVAFSKWVRENPLAAGLSFSVLVHALVLAVHFVAPDAFRLHSTDTPLDVVLVNAKSDNAPVNAKLVAQANLLGGGEQDKVHATTPLPARDMQQPGSRVARAEHQVSSLETLQEQLLTQMRSLSKQRPRTLPAQRENGKDERAVDQQIAKLQAVIAQNVRAYEERPKRGQITANTREVVYAEYYDALRRKIERLGTEHFPEAGGRRLYGQLIVTLNVSQDGQLGYDRNGYHVIGVEIERGSGDRELDRRAVAIVRASAPFAKFTKAMRARYDILQIVTRMTFSHHGVHAEAIQGPSH